jgi:hypothetical protein
MENGEEGCASPTAAAADSEFAIRRGNSMPKIPDAADKSRPSCGEAQLGGVAKGCEAESAADCASPVPTDALGGRA